MGTRVHISPCSPQIQAASERLQQLREKDLRRNAAAPNQSGSGVVSGFPSASQEVLDAQRKRFEELKVCTQFMLAKILCW